MTFTRREFIRGVGVAAASLVLLRCSAWPSEDDSARGRLRRVWMRLDWLAGQSAGDADRGDRARQDLTERHRVALDELVGAGELSPEVADELQAAFDAAAYHVYRSNAPITCYEPMMVDFAPASSDQLTTQADLLAEMADRAQLDPTVVSQAQAGIERDIAFLSLTSDEKQALYDALIDAASQGAAIPPFDQVELDVPLEAKEAARFLVELLLEG